MAEAEVHDAKRLASVSSQRISRSRADRVRGMTDEDLAEFLEKVGGCGPSFDKEYCNNVNGCPEGINCWLDWLKQEESDG